MEIATEKIQVGKKVRLYNGFEGVLKSKEVCDDFPKTLKRTGGFNIMVEDENQKQSFTYINSVEKVLN